MHIKSKAGQLADGSQLLETNTPGIFAAGDVRDKSTKQVVSAAGDGGSAALMIREYLKGM
jgi:thioredoxin reductase (NADPH)